MNRNVTIVVIILVLVVIAGYLVWLRSKYQPTVTPQIETETVGATPSPMITASPSAMEASESAKEATNSGKIATASAKQKSASPSAKIR